MREMQLNIRRAKPIDFSSIYHFLNELEEMEFEIKTIESAFTHNLSNPDFVYLIAELKSKPIGYLSCHSQYLLHHGGHKVAEIQEMFVAPESRKIGVGKRLIDELKSIARENGIIQIEVTSNRKRTLTHHFYSREGFIETHKKFTWKIK